ncbi:MAG: hypothetical protein IPK65_02350 [Gammaproteobacteria bacterium]|nr:hypothetical protein [Gammaproteobacteria bacterium]
MLSFIYRHALDFERVHGEKPNMLYLNRFHFEYLRDNFADPEDIETMMRLLGMTIMISEDAVNPRLARIGRPVPPLVSGAARATQRRTRT